MRFSIIMPTLNEEKTLQSNKNYIQYLRDRLQAELIIVDGSSNDNTRNAAKILTTKVFCMNSSRSAQMNQGAWYAEGEYLIFLHADTKLSKIAIKSLLGITDHFEWGFFSIRFSSNNFRYRILSYLINLRSKIFRYATGDQVFIIKNNTFKKIKGYKNIRLMEDIEISRRLKKISLPNILTGEAFTSIRRWEKYGFLKTVITMRLLRLLYHLGVSPSRLERIYNDTNNKYTV